MIPKIIHLCWLSGDPYPTDIQLCLDSWKKHLPDYEIWLWDTKRFDIDSTRWTRQAFDAKKYAFAADYIRLYALYNYGGIYLDSDVLVYKSLDPLLSLPYFVGHDQAGCFEAAVIGCEPGCQWIKDILDSYEGSRSSAKTEHTTCCQCHAASDSCCLTKATNSTKSSFWRTSMHLNTILRKSKCTFLTASISMVVIVWKCILPRKHIAHTTTPVVGKNRKKIF